MNAIQLLLVVTAVMACGSSFAIDGTPENRRAQVDRYLAAVPPDELFADELKMAASRYDSGYYAAAFELYEGLAMQGSAHAQLELGRMYERGEGATQDDAAAARWLGEAATNGLAIAQFELGSLYALEDSSVQDFAQATKWFREAAMQGHAEAQFNIGIAYEKGYSVAVDPEQALNWFLLAAEQEHDSAQFKLGVMYMDGFGTLKDEAAAFRWFRRAADNGNPGAQYNMGVFYAIGFRVEQNREQAKLWLEKSVAQGFGGAETTLAELDELVVEARDSPQSDVAEIDDTQLQQKQVVIVGNEFEIYGDEPSIQQPVSSDEQALAFLCKCVVEETSFADFQRAFTDYFTRETTRDPYSAPGVLFQPLYSEFSVLAPSDKRHLMAATFASEHIPEVLTPYVSGKYVLGHMKPDQSTTTYKAAPGSFNVLADLVFKDGVLIAMDRIDCQQ